MTPIDLYDLSLRSYQSDLGGPCDVCGDLISPDDDVVLADSGEVHAQHVLGRPEECVRVEDDRVLIADVVVGYVIRFETVGGDVRYVAAGLDSGASVHETLSGAARATISHTYPEGN